MLPQLPASHTRSPILSHGGLLEVPSDCQHHSSPSMAPFCSTKPPLPYFGRPCVSGLLRAILVVPKLLVRASAYRYCPGCIVATRCVTDYRRSFSPAGHWFGCKTPMSPQIEGTGPPPPPITYHNIPWIIGPSKIYMFESLFRQNRAQ